MTSSISVPAQKLRVMLTAVLPHAGADDTLPALNSVSFEVRDGTLFLAATDRYTIGIAREPVTGAIAAGVPDQSALLPLEAARELRRMLKKRPGVAAILIEDGKLAAEFGPVSASWATLAEGIFPNWRTLLHHSLTGTQEPMGDNTGVNPEMLARITVLSGRTLEALSIRCLMSAKEAAKENPFPMVVATLGDWFIGAVMPVRLGEDVASQWASWTTITAPVAAGEATAPDAEASGE